MKLTLPVLLSVAMLLAAGWQGQSEVVGVEPSAAEGFEFSASLSESGFFADMNKKELVRGFVPYELNVPSWADGAEKDRFFRIPGGHRAKFEAEGPWFFPNGTTFLQNIRLAFGGVTRLVETRVIVKGKDGLSFATYVWNEDQKDAVLDKKGRDLDITTERGFMLWKVTPVSKCTECHNPKTQSLLGLTTAQLNRDRNGKNQLDDFTERNLLVGVPEKRDDLDRLHDPLDASQPLDNRARGYLDTNCSICHRPDGNGSGLMDLRFDTPFEKTGLGHYKETLIKGKPFKSWIYLRMIYTDRRQMPGLLTVHVDDKGANIIHDWCEVHEGRPLTHGLPLFPSFFSSRARARARFSPPSSSSSPAHSNDHRAATGIIRSPPLRSPSHLRKTGQRLTYRLPKRVVVGARRTPP